MNGQWLSIISEHHKEWVGIVKSFGSHDAEDIVQEMYLRVYTYTKPEKIVHNGILNKGFIWFTLRNLYLTNCKQTSLQDLPIHIEQESTEEEVVALNKLYDKIDEVLQEQHWYDEKLFKIYTTTKLSIRDIAKETNISSKSIFNTIKNCREKIVSQVEEDYIDFKNGEFELI